MGLRVQRAFEGVGSLGFWDVEAFVFCRVLGGVLEGFSLIPSGGFGV